jgi:hypothetical protein
MAMTMMGTKAMVGTGMVIMMIRMIYTASQKTPIKTLMKNLRSNSIDDIA